MNRPRPVSANLVVLVTIGRSPAAVRMPAAERRILRLATLGCGDVQVARILGRSPAAVRRQRRRAMKRLGTGARRAITRWLIEQGVSYAGDRLSPSEREAREDPLPGP